MVEGKVKHMPTRQLSAGSRDLQRESGIGIWFFHCFGTNPNAAMAPLIVLYLGHNWLQPGVRLELLR
ncbi:unnamed protein product [Penicillium camemberti]|uniref:Str. FM013 n=1 Tax=Penicillium camemberti (strain FM 013) TaxID=1429867 RepID=A0A0G4P337_PENC3|nr:unnamed protein product [Penicillium camemberti]